MTNDELIEKLKAGHPFEIPIREDEDEYVWKEVGKFVGVDSQGYIVIERSTAKYMCYGLDSIRLKTRKMWVQCYKNNASEKIFCTDPFEDKDVARGFIWSDECILLGEPQEIEVPYD